jgi:hypothetical protein
MSRPSVSQLRSLGQLALSHRWEIDFTKFPTAVSAPGIDSPGMNIRCESTTMPKAKPNLVTNNIRGHKTSYQGITEYNGSIELTFIETINHEIANFLTQWREAGYNLDSGTQSNKNEVEAIITLYLLDNQDNPKRKFTLTGCLLEDYTPGSVDNDNNLIKPKITVHYDLFKEENV